jgi:hypothetical protein
MRARKKSLANSEPNRCQHLLSLGGNELTLGRVGLVAHLGQAE